MVDGLRGIAGALAVVAFSVLLSKSDLLAPVRYAGQLDASLSDLVASVKA